MNRIENVDLREALREIANNNTYFHLEHDLNLSLIQMARSMQMTDPTERIMVWVSYPDGIDCYSERQAFQKDTRDYNGIQFHGKDMKRDRKLAYVVELTSIENDKLWGNLFQIDITAYAENLRQNVLPSDTVRLYHDLNDNSKQSLMAVADFNNNYLNSLRGVNYYRNEPTIPIKLHELMSNMQKERETTSTPCDIWLHTSNLFDERREYFCNQLLQDLMNVKKPNSADGQSFTVSLDFHIAYGFAPEQLNQLLENLPFKNAMFAIQRGQNDMRLVVPREEVMQERQVGKEKPSVMECLKQTAQVKQSTIQQSNKSKKNELEI